MRSKLKIVKTFRYSRGIPQKGEQQSNTSAEQPSNDTILKTYYEETVKDNRVLAINLNFIQMLTDASS